MAMTMVEFLTFATRIKETFDPEKEEHVRNAIDLIITEFDKLTPDEKLAVLLTSIGDPELIEIERQKALNHSQIEMENKRKNIELKVWATKALVIGLFSLLTVVLILIVFFKDAVAHTFLWPTIEMILKVAKVMFFG